MIRIGIIGTGRIAYRFVPEAKVVEGAVVKAVYNPKLESAVRFAKEHHIPVATDKLEKLAEQVDAVYIASPHDSHYEYAKQMLSRKIHVLCEKPLALDGQKAKELFKLSGDSGCILLEAVKTAYCPGYMAMIQMAKSGVIGAIRDVEACFSKLTFTNVRELTDTKFGGSFTELGSYTMLPIFQLLGVGYKDVYFRSLSSGNGLDAYTKAEFVYNEACGLTKTGLLVKSEGQLVIAGTQGYILAKSPWWLTREFEVRFEDPNRIETHTFNYEGTGLRYEINAFVKSICGEDSMRVMPEESIGMAETMGRYLKLRNKMQGKEDNIRAQRPVNIWAHRGMSYAYPENTLKAFEMAAKLEGITGIELDVQLTRDGHMVVIHDETVDRTTDATGMVKDYTLEEIKRLRIKGSDASPYNYKGYGGVPSLAEALNLLKPYCQGKGLLINIELKNSMVRYEGMEKKVLNMVEDYGLEPFMWYSSFSPESMKEIKRIQPKARTAVLAVLMEDCIKYAQAVGADALHPYTGGLNIVLPECMKEKPVRVWNCEELLFGQDGEFKEKDLTQYGRYGVTDVFTNVPERYLCSAGC